MLASGSHLTLNTVPARAVLVAKVELDAGSANLAPQLRQRLQRVGDLTKLADFIALAALRDRDRYRVLLDFRPTRPRHCILLDGLAQPQANM